MPRLDELYGQPRVAARLQAAIASDRLHHAYLFSCSDDATSSAATQALACALNCLTTPGIGCDTCDACSRIVDGVHPDVITLVREGAARMIPIETVRSQVISRLGSAPHEARTRVFIIDEATALAGPAANALLKSLEEPPARTLFVLSTVSPEQLLPTIRSRCQRIAFEPVSAAHVAARGDSTELARLEHLARELAFFNPQRHGAIAVAARLTEVKGESPTVVAAAGGVLHSEARIAIANGRLAEARAMSERASVLGRWQVALTIHNAHPQITLEALLTELGQIEVNAHEL